MADEMRNFLGETTLHEPDEWRFTFNTTIGIKGDMKKRGWRKTDRVAWFRTKNGYELRRLGPRARR